MSNPLLNITDLIDFPAIKPEHVVDGMKALIADAESTLKTVTAQETPATWDDVITPLENKTLALSRAWGAVSHLMSVCDSPALREAYNQALPLVTQFWIGLSQSTLSDKYLAIKESSKFSDLSATRQRIINEELVEFKLAGAFLNDEGKAKLKAVKEALAKESQKFSENLMDATNAYGLIVENKKDLAGIPEDDIASFKEAAEAENEEGYKITLQVPHYLAVLRYAQNRKLRETLYHAYVTRASEFDNDGKFNNNDVMTRIVELRQSEAAILGYKNYGEVSLATKMASTPDEVVTFLRDLAKRSLAQAKVEV